MNYSYIASIMANKSFDNDPAFKDIYICIEPMPFLDGCPLGLYYPGTRTIAIPPDATEAALLHELGHRHGHYYYNNLTERYAEYFRGKHQNGRALLYLGNNFSGLCKFGTLFEEGERGAIEVALAGRLTPDQLREITGRFLSYDEVPPKTYYGNSDVPWVRMEFTKGVDWLPIIGAAMAATVLATVGTLGYAVYKVSKTLPWIIPVSLLGTGMFFMLRAMAKEAKRRYPGPVALRR